MNVLYVLPYDWGGLSQYTSELANAVSRYADVTVLGTKGINANQFSDGVKIFKAFDQMDLSADTLRRVFSLDGAKGLMSFKKISLIDKIQPDVIHFTTPLFPSIPFFIHLYGLDRAYPMLNTIHCLHPITGLTVESFGTVALQLCEKLINFRKTIIHTQRDKEELIKSKGFREEDAVVIPHGVFDRFTSLHSSGIGSINRGTGKNILFFGYVKKYKGLDCLAKALPLVTREVPDARLIIAGQGNLSPYRDLLTACGSSSVEIHNDFVEDEMTTSLFQRADLVVLPYNQMSGESGVLKIAYAFGKPVVVSDVGGFREVVKDGVTGVIVPPKDYRALADAIVNLLKDESLRDRIGKNIRASADDFSWSKIARKHMDVYEDILGACA